MGNNYYEHELNSLILTAILHRRHWEAGARLRAPPLIVRLSAHSRRSLISRNERGLSSSATCSDEDTPAVFTKISTQKCLCIKRINEPGAESVAALLQVQGRPRVVYGKKRHRPLKGIEVVSPLQRIRERSKPCCHAEAVTPFPLTLPFSKISADNFEHLSRLV